MTLLTVAFGFAVLLYSGLTAWREDRLQLSSVLLSVGGWACILAGSLLIMGTG